MNDEPSLAGPFLPDPHGECRRAAGAKGSPATTVPDDLEILRAIVEGAAGSTGEEFFQALVRHLASAIGVPFAAISEFADVNTRVRTLAFWARGQIQDNFEYDLPGTPCEDVLRGRLCHHPAGVKDRFPLAKPLVRLSVESYLGTPLLDGRGNVLGLLAVFDERPMTAQPRHLYILRIFAARASAELERLRAEQRLSASERRYRDLYEEAPVGYLSVGVDGRILSANHRATQLVGFSAQELEGLSVADLFASPPAGKTLDAEPFQRFLAGEELSGLEVEMRRKDGRPLWVSLWMKPIRGPDGKVLGSRSIWVDVTDRVLAEAERARLQQQNLYLQDEIKASHNFDELIGQSAALQAVLDQVRRVAPTDASVLITGETGTGKELIARAIHSAGKRRDKPLIKINCAAIPTGLLPADFPVPIVIVQHMPPMFTRLLAERLSAEFSLRVQEGHAGSVLQPGHAWIAPGDYHMIVVREGTQVRTRVHQAPPENSCRPAVDVLLRSVAQTYGPHSLTVILTGMGQDGLRGCEAVREAGGQILAQDEVTSVVWGMPGYVARAGLADRVLPLSLIGDEILRRVQQHQGKR
jgi:PAS domain S-box-containing protein